MPPSEKADSKKSRSPSEALTEISGVGDAYGSRLRNAGYENVTDVRDATADDLVERAGIPRETAEKVIEETELTGKQKQSTLAEARSEAAKIDGAKAKTVRSNGSQQVKILELDQEIRKPGANVEIRKG